MLEIKTSEAEGGSSSPGYLEAGETVPALTKDEHQLAALGYKQGPAFPKIPDTRDNLYSKNP